MKHLGAATYRYLNALFHDLYFARLKNEQNPFVSLAPFEQVELFIRERSGFEPFLQETQLDDHHIPKPGSITLDDLAEPLDLCLLRGNAQNAPLSDQLLFTMNRVRVLEPDAYGLEDEVRAFSPNLRFVEITYALFEPGGVVKMYETIVGGDQSRWDRWMRIVPTQQGKPFFNQSLEHHREFLCLLCTAAATQYVRERSLSVCFQRDGLPSICLPITPEHAQALFSLETVQLSNPPTTFEWRDLQCSLHPPKPHLIPGPAPEARSRPVP